MDWVKGFYSRTGSWWGPAEARITGRDHERVALLHRYAGTGPHRVLELGSGYGTTAAATAQAGHTVTAVELSDRVRFGEPTPGLTVLNEDFYTVRPDGLFDVVTYWNGFGVGSDADQRRLLTRVAAEWLRPGGVALIDVSDPFVWSAWHGDETHRVPDPARGYAHELHERTTFDPVTCTATDTWWPAGREDEAISQKLRCYTPADLALLLEGTGLELLRLGDTRRGDAEYLAVLRPELPCRPELPARLTRWHADHRAELDAAGVTSAVSESPAGVPKVSASLSMDLGSRLSQLVVWDSGETELALADTDAGLPAPQSRHIATPADVDDLLDQQLNWIGYRPQVS